MKPKVGYWMLWIYNYPHINREVIYGKIKWIRDGKVIVQNMWNETIHCKERSTIPHGIFSISGLGINDNIFIFKTKEELDRALVLEML